MVNELMGQVGNSSLKLNQLLHGYNEGHRLLAASTSLNPSTSKLILSLSDLSAQSNDIKDGAYLTAYPLPELGLYALAKTWLAPEMPRPGCVWTHTLLIEFSDLSMLSDSSILDLFSRPNAPVVLEDYEKVIHHSTNQYNSCTFENSKEVESVVFSIYEYPQSRIFFPSSSIENVDLLAFAIWLQQWPRLRRNFRFCTHAPMDRSRPDGVFDLQFTTKLSPITEKKDISLPFFWPSFNSIDNFKLPEWANFIVEDIEFGSPTNEFRKFLWRYGAESEMGREAFRPLAQIWQDLSVSTETSLLNALDSLRTINPPIPSLNKRVLALLIQTYLFEGELNSKNHDIVISNIFENLDFIDALEIEASSKLAKYILEYSPNYLSKLFSSFSPISKRIVAFVPDLITSNKLLELSRNHFDIFMSILRLKPVMVLDRQLWINSPLLLEELIQFISSEKIDASDVFDFLLSLEIKNLPTLVYEFLGKDIFVEALRRYDRGENKGSEISKSWLEVAFNKPLVTLKYIAENRVHRKETWHILFTKLPYDFPNPIYGDKYLIEFDDLDQLPSTNQTFKAAYWFARAQSGVSNFPTGLFMGSFDELHNAILKGGVDSETWILLDPILPSVHWWQKWDLGLRLRMCLVESFIKFELSTTAFLNITNSMDTFFFLVDTTASLHQGKDFLRKVERMNSATKDKNQLKKLKILKKKL